MKPKYKVGDKIEYPDKNCVDVVRHGIVKRVKHGIFKNKYLVKVMNDGIFCSLVSGHWIDENEMWKA